MTCELRACVQVSQYTFAMCSYRERKADPTEIQQLDGFTVDYCEQSLMEGHHRQHYYHHHHRPTFGQTQLRI